jgi:anti-sigma factor RsiW
MPMLERNDPQEQNEFLISRYLDGALDEAQGREFEARVQSDAGLAGLLERHRAVEGMVRAWGQEVPDVGWPAFESEFQRRRALAEPPLRRSSLVFKLFAPLAAAAAILMAFLLMPDAETPHGTRLASAPEVMIEIARPQPVSTEPGEAYVSYSYRPRETEAKVSRSGPEHGGAALGHATTVVIAYASVGARVDWSNMR